MKILLLSLLVAGFYVLHQDVWNWKRVEPLAFGFLPVGLWYHVLYSVAAAVVMAVLVRFAWPSELERQAEETPDPAGAGPSRH